MLTLTTDHPASSYNIPVVIDSETRQVYDYPDGLRMLRQQHELSRAEFAALADVSPRTVENWEQARYAFPDARALRRLAKALE